MSASDVVAAVGAGVVTVLVCLAFAARTRHEPSTARTPLALGVGTGLSALVAVLAVHLVPVAGQGDPRVLGQLLTTGAEALVRPATIVVVVLAAAAGVIVGALLRNRGAA